VGLKVEPGLASINPFPDFKFPSAEAKPIIPVAHDDSGEGDAESGMAYRRELVSLEWELGSNNEVEWEADCMPDAEAAIRALTAAGYQVSNSGFFKLKIWVAACASASAGY